MPSFEDRTVSDAPVEEVWKLLYDPARFPEWLEQVETVVPGAGGADGDVILYYKGHPDFPMPQALHAADGRTLVVSCLNDDLEFSWHLEPLDDGGTAIAVHVEIPEAQRHRLDDQRGAISAAMRRLAALAAA